MRLAQMASFFRSARGCFLVDVLVITSLFILLFHVLARGVWTPNMDDTGAAEGGLYVRNARYIPLLWEKFSAIGSAGDFLRWIPGFVFQLAPMETTEKPIYVVALGYYRLIEGALFGFAMPQWVSFNILCMIVAGLFIARLFRSLSSRLAGYVVCGILFTSVIWIHVSVGGFHTTLGVTIALLLLSLCPQFIRRQEHAPKRIFLVGVGCSVLPFISPHMVPISVAFIIFFAWRVWMVRAARAGLMLSFTGGVGALFVYYAARDIAFHYGALDFFRRHDFAREVADLYKAFPLVYGAFLSGYKQAADQNLPVDLTYAYYLVRTCEGPMLVIGLLSGVVLGVIGSVRSSAAAKPRVWMFYVVMALVVIHIAVFALLRLPYLNRSYVPVVVMLLVLGGLGYTVFLARYPSFRARLLTCALAGFVVFAQLHHYLRNVVGHADDAPPIGELNSDKPLDSSQRIWDHLASMEQRGATQITLRPLGVSFGHDAIANVQLYCYFLKLMKLGLRPDRIQVDDQPRVVVDTFSGEHAYFQLLRKRETSTNPIWLVKLNIRLANEFGVYAYHTFGVSATMAAAQKAGAASLTCEGL